jgi:hypothetical protein
MPDACGIIPKPAATKLIPTEDPLKDAKKGKSFEISKCWASQHSEIL